ncbi:MAG: Asd/ArgC dimerization domain-containing protein [Acidobacteriota bacterium]
MTTIALIDPVSLIGEELRDQLGRRPDLWQDLVLVSRLEEQIGTLTSIDGAAAMVKQADPESLNGADIAVFCGSMEGNEELFARLPASATRLLFGNAHGFEATAVVAGVNELEMGHGETLLTPHPSGVLLSHLLHPLRDFGIEQAVATLIEPASFYNKAGLDELYAQARNLVALVDQQPSEIFGRQLAFNLYPSHQPADGLVSQVAAVVGSKVEFRRLQGSVFHGISAALTLRFRQDIHPDEAREALAAHPWCVMHEDPETLGPIDAAQSDLVLIGPVDPGLDHRTLSIWAVMDNLTRGGASNALRILDVLAGTESVS